MAPTSHGARRGPPAMSSPLQVPRFLPAAALGSPRTSPDAPQSPSVFTSSRDQFIRQNAPSLDTMQALPMRHRIFRFLPGLFSLLAVCLGVAVGLVVYFVVTRTSTNAFEVRINGQCSDLSSALQSRHASHQKLLLSFASLIAFASPLGKQEILQSMFRHPNFFNTTVVVPDFCSQLTGPADRAAWEAEFNLTIREGGSSVGSSMPRPVQPSYCASVLRDGYDYLSNPLSAEAIKEDNPPGKVTMTQRADNSSPGGAFLANSSISLFARVIDLSPSRPSNTFGFIIGRIKVVDFFNASVVPFHVETPLQLDLTDSETNDLLYMSSTDSLPSSDPDNASTMIARDVGGGAVYSAAGKHYTTSALLPLANRQWILTCRAKIPVLTTNVALLGIILAFAVVFGILTFLITRKWIASMIRHNTAEFALQKSKAQMKAVAHKAVAIIQTIRDPMMLFGDDGRIWDANEEALKLCGIPRSALGASSELDVSKDHSLVEMDVLGPPSGVYVQNLFSIPRASSLGEPREIHPWDSHSSHSSGSFFSKIRVAQTIWATHEGQVVDVLLKGKGDDGRTRTIEAEAVFSQERESVPDVPRPTKPRGASSFGIFRRRRVPAESVKFKERGIRVILFRDVTEKKASERELRKAKTSAENAVVEKGALLTFVCHELRNPLHVVLSCLRLLSEDADCYSKIPAPAKPSHCFLSSYPSPDPGSTDSLATHSLDLPFFSKASTLATTISTAQVMEKILDDVMDLRRLERGLIALDVQPVSLRDLMEGVSIGHVGLSALAMEHHVHSSRNIRVNCVVKGWNSESNARPSFLFPRLILGDSIRLCQMSLKLINHALRSSVGLHHATPVLFTASVTHVTFEGDHPEDHFVNEPKLSNPVAARSASQDTLHPSTPDAPHVPVELPPIFKASRRPGDPISALIRFQVTHPGITSSLLISSVKPYSQATTQGDDFGSPLDISLVNSLALAMGSNLQIQSFSTSSNPYPLSARDVGETRVWFDLETAVVWDSDTRPFYDVGLPDEASHLGQSHHGPAASRSPTHLLFPQLGLRGKAAEPPPPGFESSSIAAPPGHVPPPGDPPEPIPRPKRLDLPLSPEFPDRAPLVCSRLSPLGLSLASLPAVHLRALSTASSASSVRSNHVALVLVVEDNKLNQKLAKRMVSKMGYGVLVANHGDEAVQVLERLEGQVVPGLSENEAILAALGVGPASTGSAPGAGPAGGPAPGACAGPSTSTSNPVTRTLASGMPVGVESVQVCLMDLNMPVCDGYEALRKIRQHGWDLRVIAVTANATDADRKRCFDAGFDGFVSKPFTARHLQQEMDRVQDLLRSARIESVT